MTPERLTLELLARIAGEADPAAFVDEVLAEPAGAPDDVVAETVEAKPDGSVERRCKLRDGTETVEAVMGPSPKPAPEPAPPLPEGARIAPPVEG